MSSNCCLPLAVLAVVGALFAECPTYWYESVSCVMQKFQVLTVAALATK
jgi:hypothetical protein